MSLVLADQVLTLEQMAEVVAIVRAGLGASFRHWSPTVYALLDEWCDQVEERLDEGDSAVPDLPAHAPVARRPAPSPAPAPPTDPDACRVPAGAAQGRCAYAGPDGLDACKGPCIYVPTPPRPAPTEQRPPRRPSRPPRASRPGELHCPRHDKGAGAWLPVAAFRRRVDLAGVKYQSWCRECTSAYAKSKYLSTETLKALAGDGIIVGTLSPSDPLLEKRCPLCPEKWKPTDRIVAGGVIVFHRECLITEEDHAAAVGA